jgi:hypothetical protein
MTMTIRRAILRANALFLLLASMGGLANDVSGTPGH